MMQGDTRRGRATNPAGATGSFLCHHKGHPGPRNDAIRGPGSAISFPTDESMFGWIKAEAIDMGPMGTYQLFATGNGPVGGMMTKPDMIPVPYWGYYFNVSGIDSAAERVTAGGGKVVNGPMQVPGGQWIVQCSDPQGAVFALVALQR
jgi:predicted enzyme related to lactoylglutathione lyase